MGYRDATSGKWIDPCLAKLKHGEPFVCLRGQDMLAIEALLKWCEDATKAGVPTAKVADMMENIKAMEAWQPRKIPD